MSYPALFTTPGVKAFAEAIDAERVRQIAKWGDQRHPDVAGDATLQCERREAFDEQAEYYRSRNDRGEQDWSGILLEEAFEAAAEVDPAKIRAELVQVAAVCQAWAADLDQRAALGPDAPATCGRCERPFDPADTRWDGTARYRATAWCRSCVDRCHESADVAHTCPVCA